MKDSKTLFSLIDKAGLESCRDALHAWLSADSIDACDKETLWSSLAQKAQWPVMRECFYRELEFGTGGMRGIRGPGPNRMNRYVVRRATAGLALAVCDGGKAPGPVVVAYDSRVGSKEFAFEAACTLLAYGVPVALFPTVQTTPALSFAVRHLGAAGGICMTASHNPPAYGGFKMYGPDGAQLIPPLDQKVLGHIRSLKEWDNARALPWSAARTHPLLTYVSTDVINAYFKAIETLQFFPHSPRSLKIVYTPLHGTGLVPVVRALNEWGFEHVAPVPEQSLPDGHFPSVEKPNPEEPQALTLATAYAQKLGFPFVAATDPDADRLAIAIRDPKAARSTFVHQSQGDFVLLNGNQTGALMLDHVLSGHKRQGTLLKNHAVIKTIVTSQLLERIARGHGVPFYNTLTGFKWIAGLVKQWEEASHGETPQYLFGTEESYGYMPGTYVRDKDGVAALCIAAEMCDGFEKQGITACDALMALYKTHGAWCEDLISLDLEGELGSLRIQSIMAQWRSSPPQSLGGMALEFWYDFSSGEVHGQATPQPPLSLPPSDVLQFYFQGGTQVSIRPSGTEPKLKVYISVCVFNGQPQEDFQRARALCDDVKKEIRVILAQ